MNWEDVGSAILKYAPLAGAALSSPVGAAIGVGTVIANLFGVDAKPDKVMDYINANPDKAEERLKFEMANNLDLQKLALSVLQENNRAVEKQHELGNQKIAILNKDAENARGNIGTIIQSNSMIFMMAALIFGSFGILIYSLYLIASKDVSATESPLLSMIIGFFGKGILDALKLFFPDSGVVK
jgi:hypothetical protein